MNTQSHIPYLAPRRLPQHNRPNPPRVVSHNQRELPPNAVIPVMLLASLLFWIVLMGILYFHLVALR